MKLDQALKISAVERALDDKKIKGREGGVAKRPYPQLSGSKDKCMLAFSLNVFQIAWESTYEAIEIGLNPDFDKVFQYDDWEPL